MFVLIILNKMIIASVLSFSMIYFWYKGSNGATGLVDLTEGSNCVTNNINGTCVKMHTCSILVVDIMHPHMEKKYPDICSYDGDTPIVCCTSCKYDFQYENISNAVFAPSGKLFFKAGQKFWDKCLDYSKYASFFPRCWIQNGVRKRWDEKNKCHYLEEWEYLAVGGMHAVRDTYTHMALLGFGFNEEYAQWLCGGSLISEKFILTAGHCTLDPNLGPVRYAALGILKRSDPAELWQRYRISRIIPHPEYHPPSKYHDIALLETHKPVAFNKAVFPACLLSLEDPKDEYEFNDVTAIGWGALGHQQPMADTLQVIKIETFSASTCKSQYPPHRLLKQGYNSTTQMCYGDRERSVDTCKGDSGGPLQIEISDLCMYFVMGVTSFGRECGHPGQAGVYTRVQHYVPWIESVVWPDL